MPTLENTNIIKETITQVLKKMRFDGEVAVNNVDDDSMVVNIHTPEAGYLIGQAGVTLDALQYVCRLLVNKKTEVPIRFIVDVNNYRKDRIDLLKEMAKSIAKQALTERVTVTLQPMPAYERRIIHMALVDHPQVSTESIGNGLERKIVVRPID